MAWTEIVVEVVAQVADVVGNQNGTTLMNTATLAYGSGSTTASATATVVEPKLTVTKTPNKTHVDANEPITYTVTVSNLAANGSAAPAFNLDLTDLLASENLTLQAGSVTTSTGTIVTGNGSGDTTIEITDAELDLGQSLTITYVAAVTGPPTVNALPRRHGAQHCHGRLHDSAGRRPYRAERFGPGHRQRQ